MRRRLALVLATSIVLLAGASSWTALAQTSGCQLAPVFLMLRDMIGRDRTGECLAPMVRNEAGDVNQTTTRGTMTFRTADLVAAFSDGTTTWLYGPNGLENRPSNTRFAWENTPPAGAAGAGQPAPNSAAAPALTSLPIVLEGDQAGTTRAFDLPAGEFVVKYSAGLQRGKSSCYVGSYLRRFDDRNPGKLLVHTTINGSNDRNSSGQTRLFDVTPGRYVLDITTTGCTWKITIQK